MDQEQNLGPDILVESVYVALVLLQRRDSRGRFLIALAEQKIITSNSALAACFQCAMISTIQALTARTARVTITSH